MNRSSFLPGHSVSQLPSLLGVAVMAMAAHAAPTAAPGAFRTIEHYDVTTGHLFALAKNTPPLPIPPLDAAAWESRKESLRPAIRECLSLPADAQKAPWPLQARFTGVDLDYADYTLKHLVFCSRPGVWVTANLYVPKRTRRPAPAVLLLHGHSDDAKAAGISQIPAINLARQGFVCLVPDGYGYGERGNKGNGGTGHRDEQACYLTGTHVMGLQTWDNIRAIDYLVARTDLVDARRLGVTGCSGGGTQTMYLFAVDPRLACAVPVCAVDEIAIWMRGTTSHCNCNHVPNLYRHADYPDLLALGAPKPVLIISAGEDHLFSVAGSQAASRKLHSLYQLYGAADAVRRLLNPGERHGYSKASREAMYGWMNFHLNTASSSTPIAEPATTLESVAQLNCGLPVDSIATIRSISDEAARSLPPEPENVADVAEFAAQRTRLLERVRGPLFGQTAYPAAAVELAPLVLERSEVGPHLMLRVQYFSERDVPVFAELTYPRQQRRLPLVISLGRNSLERDGFLQAGCAVLWPGLRPGEGDSRGWPEYETVTLSLLLGKHVFGMRVWDLRRAVDYATSLGDLVDPDRIVIASGERTEHAMLALFAAATDSRLKAAYLANPLITYRAAPGERWHRWPLALFVPNLLKFADVPQLIAMVAPRRLFIAGARRPDNSPVPLLSIRDMLRPSTNAYALFDSTDRLTIQPAHDPAEMTRWLQQF